LLAASEYAGNVGVSIDKEVRPKASLQVNALTRLKTLLLKSI
jgi:hypothetical protein